MNTIKNISFIILFFGIILLTIYLTNIYNDENKMSIYDKKYINMMKRIKFDKFYSKRPSSIFKKMFKLPSIWMGYSDSAALKMIKSSSKSKK